MSKRGGNRRRGHDLRLHLATLYGTDCYVCGRTVRLHEIPNHSYRQPDSATVEHVVPRWRGGSNRLTNLRLSHHRCNNLRGALDLAVQRWEEQVNRCLWVLPAWPALEGDA